MIDLRIELNKIIYQDKELDKLLLRHLIPTRCECMSQSPMIYDLDIKAEVPNKNYRTTPDPVCPNCEGHGWIFEEYIVEGKMFFYNRKVAHEQEYHYGTTLSNIVHIYMPTSPINEKIMAGDIFYELAADEAGNLVDPIVRIRKWLVNDIYYVRLDNNKVEFLKVFVKAIII